MKKILALISFFALASIVFYACKEEDVVTNQQFVQNYIVGKWPFKAMISINKKNGVIIKNDTLIYGLDSATRVVDTVRFTAEGKYIQKNKTDTLGYTIDATGDNIIYSRDSIGKWKINFLRIKSIILSQEKSEKQGSDTFIYYKEQQLIRN